MFSLNDSNFVKHEPCPKCGSRDNLGVWSDGHKYCFGCKYYERGFPNLEDQPPLEASNRSRLGYSYSKEIREDARRWLKKYGITDEEIQTYGIRWDPAKECLVLGYDDETGEFATRRYFGTDHSNPRYLAGELTKHGRVVFIEHHGAVLARYGTSGEDTCVFVEDFISAIRVGRFASACPVFGSTARKALNTAAKRFKGLVWWLDTNMYSKSLLEASRARSVGYPVLGVIKGIHPDPKDHTDDEINNLLKLVLT